MAGFLCFYLPERLYKTTPNSLQNCKTNSRFEGMLFFQIHGEAQSQICTETRLVWVLQVKKVLWRTLCYLHVSGLHTWLVHLSWHVHLIPLTSVQASSHEVDLSAQTCCPWSTGVLKKLPRPAATYHQLWDGYAARQLGPSLWDPCPQPCYSSWVSPLCYMSCLQDTAHCRHWPQK